MAERRRFPWVAVLIGVGCAGLICFGGLMLAGGAAIFLSPRSSPRVDTLSSQPGLTGEQRQGDHSVFDDFSSDALGWPRYDDGMTLLEYEDGAYGFQITEPDYFDWAYFPVDFIPYEIQFDVWAASEAHDGTAGVFCHFQDIDNYYYVELDLVEGYYLIGQYLDGEDVYLTSGGAGGQGWVRTRALNPLGEINHIGVSCHLEEITLLINDKQVEQVRVRQPLDRPNEAAFFVYAYEDAGKKGNKVFFDNLEAWQPGQ